ncbi:TIGR04157 family glycosyltransferase [Parabacteroides sp.]
MKKQVYLFAKSSRASIYGIGTYIRQMIECLAGKFELSLHVVLIGADVEHFERKEMSGYDLYSIPQFCIPMEDKSDSYQRNIYYLLRSNCNYYENNELIFIFNYSHHLPLIRFFKDGFPNSRFYFVIHYQNWCFSLNGDVARLKPIIQTDDVSSSLEREVYLSFLKEKEVYQIVDRVVCLSEFTFSLLNEMYGISCDKLVRIYNGLKDEKKILSVEARNLLKKRYDFSCEEKIILFVGRLDAIKGIEMLIRSFGELLQKNKNYRLVVIGEGNFSFCLSCCGTYWNKVVFTGRLDKEQLYDFYQIADVGVIPSMHEQCSYVAIEMMMFGLPLVVSKMTGLKEMVQNGRSGYTFDMEEYCEKVKNELADLIFKVLDAPLWKRNEMRRLSRSSYEERYSVEEMRKKYLDLIILDQSK